MRINIALLIAIYGCAAIAEIGGCYAVRVLVKGGHSVGLYLASTGALGIFASLLAIVPSAAAGKTYALYGAFYILTAAALTVWLEGATFTPLESLGLACVLIGTILMTAGKVAAV